MSLQTLFEILATRTWMRIRDGHLLSVPQGEVSLTDDLLLELVRARPRGLVVAKTPIDRESQQGTDWEWWIGSTEVGWLRYAIQAKRLDVPGGKYSALGHKVAGRRQVDILISYATNNDAIPLYCFFNYTTVSPLDLYWHCQMTIDSTQLGCSIAPAALVETIISSTQHRVGRTHKRTFEGIHQHSSSRPWRCLVGCPEFVAPYAAGKGNRSPMAVLGDGTALVHPDLPPNLRQLLAESPDSPVVTSLSEGRFDWSFFRGEAVEIPRYIVVADLGLTAGDVSSKTRNPLLLPERDAASDSMTEIPKTPSEFKKIRK